MEVGIVELEDEKELGKHAKVQLQQLDATVKHVKVDQFMDAPGEAQRLSEEVDAVLVLADVTREKYVREAIESLLKVEVDSRKPLLKVVEEKDGQDRHSYAEHLQEEARRRSEEIVSKLEDS